MEAYYQMPNAEQPAHSKFRIGDDEDEFGIIDRRFAPKAMRSDTPGDPTNPSPSRT